MTGQIDRQNDDYADKLIKLLPAEGIAALTTIKTMLGVSSETANWLWGSAAVVGIFVFFWAKRVRKIESVQQLIFILAAYVLWTMNILWELAADLPGLQNAPQSVPAVGSVLFTLFIPFVFTPPAQLARD